MIDPKSPPSMREVRNRLEKIIEERFAATPEPIRAAKRCWPWSHQWTKWQLDPPYTMSGVEFRCLRQQSRECLRCGKYERCYV